MTALADELRNDLVYQRNTTADQIAADIKVMEAFDREMEKQQKKWMIIAILAAPTLLGGLFSVAMTERMFALGIFGGVLLACGLGMLIVGLIQFFRYRRCNLDDMRYLVLFDLIRLIKTDMKPDEPINVRMSFHAHNARGNYLRKGKAGRWNVKYYSNAWLSIGGRLMDGAKFMITLTEKQQDRHRTKTSRSGKLKTKHKTKNAGEACVTIRFKAKRYPLFAQNHESMQQAVQLPSNVMIKSLRCDEESITLQVKHLQDFSVGKDDAKAKMRINLVASMMLSCYHVLNQSRRAAS